MREVRITENEAGQRFDKYLKKYFPEVSQGFLYKMLRKKRIVLNGRKASGSEKINTGDTVKMYLSDETAAKFSGLGEDRAAYGVSDALQIVYEDSDILLMNKPAGMLSQKADRKELSVVEYMTGYLLASGQITEEELHTFRPGVCNRLDRNTSGLVAGGKTLAALHAMSEVFRDRSLEKYYLCIVRGQLKEPGTLRGFLKKEERTNRAEVIDEISAKEQEREFRYIETGYVPLAYNSAVTLLKVHLVTGRPHQIRAHLSHTGHPLLGDYKYGDRKWNDIYKEKYGVSFQLLHAYEVRMPGLEGQFAYLAGRKFTAAVPPLFYKMIREIKWEHGIQEALGVLH